MACGDKDCTTPPRRPLQEILLIISAVFSGVAMLIGMWNKEKISDVKDTQVHQVQRAEAVQEVLETQTEKTGATLGKIEKATNAIQDTIGPQLYASWKYLEDVVDRDPTPVNRQKATEAKTAYDAHVKKSKN